MDPRIEKYAKILVRYSVNVQPGDKVAIEASTTSLLLVREVFRQILLADGHPILLLDDDTCMDLFYQIADEHQLTYIWPIEIDEINAANKWITIWGEANTKSRSQINPSKLAMFAKARKPIDDVWTKRTCGYGEPYFMPRVGTQFPCQSAAQDAEMSLIQYENFVYKAAKINGPNDPILAWQREEKHQEELISKLKGIRKFHFQTSTDTDIEFTLDNQRRWWTCAGRQNLPDGEIYTTPLEDSANGLFCPSFPTVYNGVEVGGVILRFRKGEVVEVQADKNLAYLEEMLQLPGARHLGELAFGLNFDIQQFTRNILFDEKIGGTFHIALGDAYPNTGGTNKSQIHWDFIDDLQNEGVVLGDGKLIQENGRWYL